MDIQQFVDQSIGQWRSQRSGHNLAFQFFEEVRSVITIEARDVNDAAVLELCQQNNLDPALACSPFWMTWKGESDWDDDSKVEGSCLLVPIPDRPDPNRPDRPTDRHSGKLLRSQGYAETMPAIGDYYFADNVFVLTTSYDRAAAEERIWFAAPNIRIRVSLIKTSDGTGVVTASYASEIRSIST
jgi:phycoerythrin-associated linker protein